MEPSKRVKDLRGTSFGDLTVSEYLGLNSGRSSVWGCVCSCGNSIQLSRQQLVSEVHTCCGCKREFGRHTIDLRGQTFGKLLVTDFSHTNTNGDSHWKVTCECGTEKVVSAPNLKSKINPTVSCGCAMVKHGDAIVQTRLYQCWYSMKRRAKARGDSCYVYEPWLEYIPFKEWALENGYTDELVLCRNGDTGDYCPDNVRWDTPANNIKESWVTRRAV